MKEVVAVLQTDSLLISKAFVFQNRITESIMFGEITTQKDVVLAAFPRAVKTHSEKSDLREKGFTQARRVQWGQSSDMRTYP